MTEARAGGPAPEDVRALEKLKGFEIGSYYHRVREERLEALLSQSPALRAMREHIRKQRRSVS
ncbi:MAG TPA: hypothetical protein IAB18_02575 [Candidatus Avisuccinivibrio pullicola]|nr:hypothetical protein [Candidatus Avisuccinivibrio pullicola]